jgi:hypothetical protein
MDLTVLFVGLQNLDRYFTCALMARGNLKWPSVVIIRCKSFSCMKISVYSGNPHRNTPVIFFNNVKVIAS